MAFRMYTLLGWLAWRIIKFAARHKAGQNKAKLGAVAGVIGLLAAGAAAAKAVSGDEGSS